jgi:hypothetical protein
MAAVKPKAGKEYGKANGDLAVSVLSRWSKLDQDRNYWLSMWQSIADLVMPRKSYILNTTVTPNTDKETRLFDSTAVRANMVLSAGCMSYITPADSRWFSLEAPESVEGGDGVNEYFSEVTEVITSALANSNFHTAIHELYLDRGCFGTAVLFVEPGDKSPLNFKTFDVGSFAISENHEGYVDTIFRKYEMTVRNLVENFGLENVSDLTRTKYNAENSQNWDQKVEVIHAIYPRPEGKRDKTKLDGPNKPIASCYIEVAAKHVLRESGYDEQPFFCTRYLKWQQSPYGWSPSWVALPDARQLNFLQKQMDALAELAAFPRMLVPDSHEGSLDLRAGGITYFNASEPSAIPREWMTQGRYDIGQDRIKEKQRHIEEAFSVPLFQMFSAQDQGQPISATEVRAREAERLMAFSPTFSRLTTELLTPLLQRVYGLLARNGAFPQPPEALIQQDAKGELFLPEPKVVFNSRIALAVKAMENTAVDRTMQRAMSLVQITQDPSVLDNFDTDKMARETSLNDGIDAEFLRPVEQVAQMRQQRAQAQQQQAEMQAQQHAAEVAAKMGGIKGDSVMGQMAQQGQ